MASSAAPARRRVFRPARVVSVPGSGDLTSFRRARPDGSGDVSREVPMQAPAALTASGRR